MVQAAIVELRRSAQRFGDEAVNDFKLFEDGKVQLHIWLAEGLFKSAQLLQSALAAAFLFGGRGRGSSRRFGRLSGWPEPDTADVQVFLKAVELEEV